MLCSCLAASGASTAEPASSSRLSTRRPATRSTTTTSGLATCRLPEPSPRQGRGDQPSRLEWAGGKRRPVRARGSLLRRLRRGPRCEDRSFGLTRIPRPTSLGSGSCLDLHEPADGAVLDLERLGLARGWKDRSNRCAARSVLPVHVRLSSGAASRARRARLAHELRVGVIVGPIDFTSASRPEPSPRFGRGGSHGRAATHEAASAADLAEHFERRGMHRRAAGALAIAHEAAGNLSLNIRD